MGAEGIDKSFLKLKFEAIAGLDADRMKLYTEDMKKYSGRVQQNLLEINKKIEANTKNIEERKTSFENSERRKKEDELIREVTQEIRNGIKNPKQYKVSDWVEGLESMPDDEIVMFNIASPERSERAKKGIECILKHNGLSAGEKTNQWLIRHELRSNSDDGCYEIFSPIMTVKDAKEIMPKLMDDLETAHLSKGLVIPARPKELFKDVVKEPCSQDAIDTGLKNLVQAGKIREALTDPNLSITKEMEERALSRLGINSFDELPETYSSLKELEAKFPKDKYLFSGTMASDDYCQLSCRNGRVGKVYATPHIDYAAKYDGVTNVGAVLGTSATGDYYISPIAGKVNGNNVYVGFINVYEQNPEDKFFDGFGMESYRHKDFDIQGMEKPEIKSVDLWTSSPNGAVILHKQAKPADRHVLSREQAINGYIEDYHSMPTTIDGKLYYTASYNAETYVTPEKNPLKAKIMHLAYQDEYSKWSNLYVPVSDKSDEAVRHILNSRQADMKDSFVNALKTDVYNRFEKQKEELNKGIVPQIREHDFECRKQAKFLAGESNTPVHTEKSQNIDRINQLRGVNQPAASAALSSEKVIEKAAEKTAVHTAEQAAKSGEGVLSAIVKADNAINHTIDKTIDKGSKLLNNTKVGRAYEKAVDAVSNTKVVKVVEKGTAKVVEKAAQTAVGKSVVKAVAKTTGSAVGKSLLKKVPLVSAAAGCYFAWDRVENGDWKGACGEVASGIAGCFPGLGTGISTAIDAGLAAKDISGAVAEAKALKTAQPARDGNKDRSKNEMRQIVLQKQGRISAKPQAQVKQSSVQNNNYAIQQKLQEKSYS